MQEVEARLRNLVLQGLLKLNILTLVTESAPFWHAIAEEDVFY